MRLVPSTLALALWLALALPAFAHHPPVTPQKKQTASGNISLTTSLGNDHVLLTGDGMLHLAIDLSATKKASAKRLPMNIALVIDRSGSMRGDKIEYTRRAARHLIEQLTDRDTISIVSYSDNVRVDLPSSPVTKRARRRALDAIDGIRAGGSTNLSGGLFKGQAEVERNLETGQVNRVILMSDGLANRGITDVKALSQQVQKASQQGISVSTMGVGEDYNEDLMTAVADNGGGNYYFIREPQQIAGIFSTELKKMFATVSQRTTVVVTLEDGVDLDQVFGYSYKRSGDKVRIPLAEMFAGQKRSILLSVRVPTVREGNTIVGNVALTYEDVSGRGITRSVDMDLAVQVTRDKRLVEKNRNVGVEERLEEVRVANVMTRAADMLKEGRGADARKVLRQEAKRAASRSKDMGGSARVDRQVKQLQKLETDFEEAEAMPAAAPSLIKGAKAKARLQKR